MAKLNFRKIGEKYLYSNIFGDWAFVTKGEHKKIQNNRSEIKRLSTPQKWIVDRFYEREATNNFRFASLHVVKLTNRCNQKCTYCFASARSIKDKECDMNIATARKIVDFICLIPEKDKRIEFHGGEPTLNFEVMKEIVSYAKKKIKNIIFGVRSNFTNMDDQKAAWFKENNIIVGTSLDGPKEIHDKNRLFEGGNGTYDTVNHWFNRMESIYNLPVSIIPVMTKISLANYREIIDEYVAKHSPEIYLKYLFNMGYGKSNQNVGYDMDAFKKFWIDSMEYIIELNKKGKIIKERNAEIIMKKIIHNPPHVFLDFQEPCGLVRGAVTYDYNGDIYPCPHSIDFKEFKLGNVFDNTYSEIVNLKISKSLIDKSRLNWRQCKECVYKPWCGTCIIDTYSRTGSFALTKEDITCRLHKFMFDYIFLKMQDKPARKILIEWIKYGKIQNQLL